MSIKTKGAVEANEQRQDVETSDTVSHFITSAIIGQIFRLAATVTTDRVFVYATYLNGKVDLTIIVGGNRYEILNNETDEERLRSSIELLEKMERVLICKGHI